MSSGFLGKPTAEEVSLWAISVKLGREVKTGRLLLGDAASGYPTTIKRSTGLDTNTEQLQTLQRQRRAVSTQRRNHEDSVHHLTGHSDLRLARLLLRSVSVPHFRCLVCVSLYLLDI